MVAGLPDDWWEYKDCAEYLGLEESTIRAYVARGQFPPADRRFGRTPAWKPATIKEYDERPRYIRRRRVVNDDICG